MNSTQLFKTWSGFQALYGDFEYLSVFTAVTTRYKTIATS